MNAKLAKIAKDVYHVALRELRGLRTFVMPVAAHLDLRDAFGH
jgi:hypothetical protein